MSQIFTGLRASPGSTPDSDPGRPFAWPDANAARRAKAGLRQRGGSRK